MLLLRSVVKEETERERETLCFYINKAFSLSKLSRENKEGSAQPSSSFDLYAMMMIMMMMMTMMMCVKKFCARCFCFLEEDSTTRREKLFWMRLFRVDVPLSRCSLKKKREAFFFDDDPSFLLIFSSILFCPQKTNTFF